MGKHRTTGKPTPGQLAWAAFLLALVAYGLFRVIIGWHDTPSVFLGISIGTLAVLLADAISDIRGDT